MKKLFIRMAALAAILILLTFLIWLTDADRQLARLVFNQNKQWPGIGRFPWNIIYTYAALPAFLMAGGALFVLVAGFFRSSFAVCRRQSLFFILLLALGPGLLVNVILKNNLGRARPCELVDFGGQYEFTQIWQHGAAGSNSSFPSGHASIAFYMLAPWFIYRYRNRKLALSFLAGGMAYGSLVGATRILQGGHFLSDVLWAGGLVYLCGEILAWLLHLDTAAQPGNGRSDPLSPPGRPGQRLT